MARPEPYKGGCGDMLHLEAKHIMNPSDCQIEQLLASQEEFCSMELGNLLNVIS
jgi:hypothetical protein